jgi:phosphonate transport system substrate-binding protein
MSHDSVYQAVSKGLYPAGGGIESTLATTRAPVREQLRVLWRTPGYTPHAIAAHPRLSSDIVAQVAQAMYAMDSDAAGKIVLAPLGFAGIAPARDADWNDIRALHIEELTTD